ncbi:grainyhead-like protein 1 homolog [Polymixia lowei]
MTEESAKKRGVVLHNADQSYDGHQAGYSEDDEVWRAFLESPLTAASKAMMSVNGDEESASALGLLYDYYKVPRDRRPGGHIKTETVLSGDDEHNKITFLVPYQDSLQTMTPLRNVPLHTVIQGSPPAPDKRPGSYPESIAPLPTFSGSLEGVLHSFPGVPPTETERLRFNRPMTQGSYSPRSQALTPDSTYTEPFKDSSCQVFPLSEDIQLRLASFNPEECPLYSSTGGPQLEYILEAPQSLRPKSTSGPISYLNKGQFYPITLREEAGSRPQQHHRVRSVVMLVFGEEKISEDQLKHWRFWQSRQHTVKQRCLDIADYKESFNTISNIEELAYNAVSFTWDSRTEARIFVSVNCLSTDFSPQKGVRGLPLNLQIDTYTCGSHGDKLVHRAISQVKVFCDKGAERKIRDEDRKQNRRKLKGVDASLTREKETTRYVDITIFKPVSDLDSQPVLFIPDAHFSTSQRHVGQSEEGEDSSGHRRLFYHTDENTDTAPAKRLKIEKAQKVLLYVRKQDTEVFDALLLKTPTLSGLLEAVTEKYQIPTETIGKVYKRCENGTSILLQDTGQHGRQHDQTVLQRGHLPDPHRGDGGAGPDHSHRDLTLGQFDPVGPQTIMLLSCLWNWVLTANIRTYILDIQLMVLCRVTDSECISKITFNCWISMVIFVVL